MSSIVEPTTLILKDDKIYTDTQPPTQLYTTSRNVTSATQSGTSSVQLYRSTDSEYNSDISNSSNNTHLFYLVHPLNADYRTDKPAYYITAASPGACLGNIRLEAAAKASFPSIKKRTAQVKAYLSRHKSSHDDELFVPSEEETLLFTAKANWSGTVQKWMDANDDEIAIASGGGGGGDAKMTTLDITVKMEDETRDALVAMWMLCLWREAAEKREVKMAALEKLTPAPVQGYGSDKTTKRTGALGGLAAGGGG
jgi:hypothetical protein